MTRVIALLILLLYPVTVSAQTLTLLAGGYFRPGRYLPVALESAMPLDDVAIEATNLVPTHCRMTGTRQIVPLLSITADVGELRINGEPIRDRLKPLSLHDSLIGIVGDSRDGQTLRRAIFPGSHVIPVQLDDADPLPGPGAAWQSLDAIVVTSAWPGGLKLDNLGDWLAGGTAVAVTGVDPPDHRLPWRPIVGGWVLRPNIAGPLGCDGNADAYLPSAMWHPDWPETLRVQIVGGAIVFSILLLAVALLPSTLRIPAFGGVGVIALIVVAIGHRLQPDTFHASGEVTVTRAGWSQQDCWTYLSRRRTGSASVVIDRVGWPVFLDPSQPQQMKVTMRFDGERIRFDAELPADHRLGFVQRTMWPGNPTTSPAAVKDLYSPMARLARALYHDAGEPTSHFDASATPTDDPDPVWPSVRCEAND